MVLWHVNGMLVQYTLQKIAKGHKKWATQSWSCLVRGHYNPLVFGLLCLTTTIVDMDSINSTFACFSLDLCFAWSIIIPSSIIVLFCFPYILIPYFPPHLSLQLSSIVKCLNIGPRWQHEINYGTFPLVSL